MIRDRFFVIRNSLHLVNNLDATENQLKDRLQKVRPFLNRFRNAVLSLLREENVCINEQMILFEGSVGFRQYVPRKRNPTGIKIYILAGASEQV